MRAIPLHIIGSILLTIHFTASFAQGTAPDSYKVIIDSNVMVAMSDGIRLCTNIFLPDAKGPFPTLLMRTPYGISDKGRNDELYFAERGYAVVTQDVRGRNGSEGIFDAFHNEGNDGFDMQEWIGSQPWCNGQIGTFGGSYDGTTQWFPSIKRSKLLKAMFVNKTFSNLHNEAYHGGAFRLMRFCPWSFNMTRNDNIGSPYKERPDSIVFTSIPLVDFKNMLGWNAPFLTDWMRHPLQDRYWAPTTVADHTQVKAAVYNIGGWFDSFQQGTLDNFIKMTRPDIDPSIRSRQRLVIGPWVHANEGRKAGDIDFGDSAIVDTRDLQLSWFDSELKGKTTTPSTQPVRLFVMGVNKWRYEKEWPLARTKYTDYYFSSKGNANTLNGDGLLTTVLSKANTTNSFLYDPANPTPNLGNIRPVDQRPIELRQDVLVFSTPALKKDIEVTGPVKALIYASSSAVNTDFTAKLVDVYPDGSAIYLCEGIIRASFRDADSLSFIQPGKIYPFSIRLWATSNVFKAGHKIRVEIASADFPLFDRNLNTGLIPALDSNMVTAKQTIFLGKDYPSCITLPVIE